MGGSSGRSVISVTFLHFVHILRPQFAYKLEQNIVFITEKHQRYPVIEIRAIFVLGIPFKGRKNACN